MKRGIRRQAAAMMATLLLLSAGCTTGYTRVPTEKDKSSGAPSGGCRTALTAKDCGGMEALVSEARSEGSLVIAGTPDETPQLEVLSQRFASTYGIKVKWKLQGKSTTQVLDATIQQRWQDQPDLFILDAASQRPSRARLDPYKVTSFGLLLPTDRRDADGFWVDYLGGVMSIGYDASRVGSLEAATLISDPSAVGPVAFIGDPDGSASAATGLAMLQRLAKASASHDSVIDYLKDANLAPGQADGAQIRRGRQTVVVDWNYSQTYRKNSLRSAHVTWKTLIPQDAELTGWTGFGINAEAVHPAAARLWEEYMFSSTSQNYVLSTGAMPTGYRYLLYLGTVRREARRQMPVLANPPMTASSSEIESIRRQVASVWKTLPPGQAGKG